MLKCTLPRKRHRLQSQSAASHIRVHQHSTVRIDTSNTWSCAQRVVFATEANCQSVALTRGRICSSTLVRLHTCTLRFEVWSGILGGAICAPRTISPSTAVELKIYLWNWSDQEHAPRVHIRFAVAECGFRIKRRQAKELAAVREASPVSASRKNELYSRALVLVPSEFRTVGEVSIDNAIVAAGTGRDIDSDTPMDITSALAIMFEAQLVRYTYMVSTQRKCDRCVPVQWRRKDVVLHAAEPSWTASKHMELHGETIDLLTKD